MKALLVIILATLLCTCAKKVVYEVKGFKYYRDDEVHIEVLLNSGQSEKYICAFPPNTDYEHMKKVQIGPVKSETLLGGSLHYCVALK